LHTDALCTCEIIKEIDKMNEFSLPQRFTVDITLDYTFEYMRRHVVFPYKLTSTNYLSGLINV